MKKRLFFVFTLLLALGICQSAWAEASYDSFLDYGKAVASLGRLTAKGTSEQGAAEARLLMRSKKPMDDLEQYDPLAVVRGPGNRYTLQFASAEKAVAAMEALEKDKNVKYVQQDAIVELDAVTEGETHATLAKAKAAAKAASPYMSWGAKAVGADELAASIQSAGSVTVAVVDTGVASHPFLNARVKLGGADFTDPSRKDGRHDVHGHGTHVAGTIVDLTQGLPVNILPVRVLGDNGNGANSGVINGIFYAADSGAKVINMSLGGATHTPYINDAEKDAVNYAHAKGVTVVVAAGNDNTDASFVVPASYRNCITVAALTVGLAKADYSNFGDPIDVAAPGSDIVSCSIAGGFVNMSGTSMASPHVAAIAAMVKLKFPGYSPARIDAYIKDNCLDLGKTGWDRTYGYGMPCFLTSDAGAEGAYTYRVVDGEAAITGYTGTDAEITLPKTLGGLKVTSVDNGAFKENAAIASVTVPGNIAQIGGNAFAGCASLKQVTIEPGVLKIGASAFENCSALSTVALPEGLRDIDSFAFNKCAALESIELPQTLLSLGSRAFASTGLTALNVPGTVKTIPSQLMIRCANLERLAINEGTVSIGTQVVSYCKRLKELDLPKSVTEVSTYAFAASSLESVRMPGVVRMSPSAFYLSASLREVTLAEGLKTIPKNTFTGCAALEKVYVPRSVEEIDEEAVIGCAKLTLHVYKGSLAEAYAKHFKIPCQYVGYQTPLEALHAEDEIYAAVSDRLAIVNYVSYEPDEAQASFIDIVWESSDPAVAEVLPVDEDFGQLIGVVGEGTATITGKAVDGSNLRVSFKVISGELWAQEMRLSKTQAALKTGETLQLSAVLLPEGVDQSVVWTSGDTSVATVTEAGLVTAVGTGVCVIAAQSEKYDELSAECTVTVASAAASESDFTYAGDEGTTAITGYTGSAARIEIPASIDGHKIDGIAAGAFKNASVTSVKIPEGITFIDSEAFKNAKKLAEVSIPDSLTRLAPDAFKGCKKLPKVKSVALKITKTEGAFRLCPVFTPATTAAAWSITAPGKKAATVKNDLVTLLRDDYVKITVKAGGKKAVVGFQSGQPYAASKITIKGNAKRTLKVGKTLTLSCKVQPKDARIVTSWSSANPEVATVDEEGVVTGVAPGKAVIVIQSDIGLSDQITVTVK